nr:IS3 family transposase [bacterium]
RPINQMDRDREVVTALNEIVAVELRWGFWKCYDRLRDLGKPWNHKRIHRVYCQMGLNQKRRAKKRLPTRERHSLIVVPIVNAVWALDFMFDSLYSGRSIRTLNVLDEANRGALGIDIATSIPASRVIRFVAQLIEIHGKPAAIRCDNGPEYISGALLTWAEQHDIRIDHIQPGKPQQNAYVERYNRTVRYGWLARTLFDTIEQVQDKATRWLWTYNHERPNMALGGITPIQKLALAA